MYTARLLIQPIIRASSAPIKSSSFSNLFHPNLRGNYGPLQTWSNTLKLKVHRIVPNSYWNPIVRKYHHHFRSGIFHNSGGKFAVNTIVGLSVIVGAINIWPRIGYCTDGFEFLPDDNDFGMLDYSDSDEDRRALVTALRKFLVPVFFLVTVFVNWGQPIVIAAKVALILYTTKPSPFSVYLVVDQLRHQAIRQHPIIYKLLNYNDRTLSCYAKKVQVEDYMFLCLARVELNDQKLNLLGILGSWWVLPLSSWLEALSMLPNSF